MQYVYPNGKSIKEKYYLGKEYYTEAEKNSLLLGKYFTGNPNGGVIFNAHRGNKIFKKKLWEFNISNIDAGIRQGEDTISSFSIFLLAKSIRVIPDFYPYYLCRREGSTTEFSNDTLCQFEILRKRLLEIASNIKCCENDYEMEIDVFIFKGYLRVIKKWLERSDKDDIHEIEDVINGPNYRRMSNCEELINRLNKKEKLFFVALRVVKLSFIRCGLHIMRGGHE